MFYAAFFPCILLIILWLIRLWEWNFHTEWYWMGVYPRTASGLLGILTEPLVHAGIQHLLSNSVPLFILSWCLFYFYKDLGYVVFPMLWVFSGLFTWCIGRESYHIGASGLIYGLSFFLFFSGVFRRYIPLMALSLVVVFLYGSTVWNMLPVWELIEANISWEGHLSGALSGFLCATLFRKYGPQKPADPFEKEEEEVEEDDSVRLCSTAENQKKIVPLPKIVNDDQMETPIPRQIVDQAKKESGLVDIGKASIREVVRLVSNLENASGKQFIKMEMGVPGLPAAHIGIDAQIKALQNGVAPIYPAIEGFQGLKDEASRFAKLFLNIDIDPAGCVPTVGSMQGSLTTLMVNSRCQTEKEYTLFIDPGFPVQKQQHHVLGLKYKTFDVYNYRGSKLRTKLEEYLIQGNIHTIIYSNPNNPSWICFSDNELKIIGELANQYDVIVMEDLAYFGMDFRHDYGNAGVPPYQPSVAHYTNNYVLLFSGSKVFSYAGERIALMMIGNHLFSRRFHDLKRFYSSDIYGRAAVYGALYAISSGTGHSAQYALAAMLKAANDGGFAFIEQVKVYGDKARVMKELFTRYGFQIVYDRDEDAPLADGFYFTISYSGFSGSALLEELLYYGISAIALDITGSERSEGLRACVSQTQPSQFAELEERLKAFRKNHL